MTRRPRQTRPTPSPVAAPRAVRGSRAGGSGAAARGTGRRGLRWSALAVAGLVLVTGCGRIPTSGPVYHYAEAQASSATPTPAYTPSGPQDGATAQQIVEGFIQAGTGVADDYAVARQYLTDSAAADWVPEARTLVHQGNPTYQASSGGRSVTASVPVTTSVDQRGIATSYSTAEDRKLSMSLTKVDGQWRIASLPDGTVVTRTQFEQLFRSFALYFFDPTYTYAVPDIRWFVNRSTVTTSLVRVLLQGPSPYLQQAVVSAFPSGTSLQRSSVPVNGETAEVALSGTAMAQASQLTAERVHSQLVETLGALSSVQSVSVSVGEKTLETGQLKGYTAPKTSPQVPDQQVGVQDSALVSYADGEAHTVSGLPALAFAPSVPAMSADRTVYAYLSSDRRRLGVLSTSGTSAQASMSSTASAPSVDVRHWVWTGSAGGTVQVLDGKAKGAAQRTVSAAWLQGQVIQSLRISRDGTRALVVTGEGSAARVWVTGIHRDSSGRPLSLGSPLRVGTTIQATQAQWVSQETVVVADAASGAVQLVSLSGEVTTVNGLSGIRGISAGNGQDQITARTAKETFRLSGTSWSRISTDVTDLSYAG